MTPSADWERLIEAGKEVAAWLESLSEDLTEDEGSTAIAVGEALVEWDHALTQVTRSEA